MSGKVFIDIDRISYQQKLQNMLSWEVSAFLVERVQSYGSFKFKTFVWEIKTNPHQPRFHACAKIEMPIISPQNRNMASNVHILTRFHMIFLVIEFLRQL